MSEGSTRAGPVWERLRRNRERNTELFESAGIRPERAGSVVCPACGAEESALFWSTTRRRGRTVFLLCPICEAAHVRYSLAGNRVLDPVFNRGTVGGGLGAVFLLVGIGLLFHFRDTAPVRAVFDDARTARDAGVAALGRATDGRFGGSYTAPAPRSSSSPLGGGASSGSSAFGSGAARQSSPSRPASTPPASPPRAAAQRYALPGDRRAELQASSTTRSALREVRYDSATNTTYIVVDPDTRAGRRALDALPGAQRVEEP